MLPIEALKIDQSFVAGLVDRVDSLTMTRAIIQLARSFGLKVTAEGVETVEQLRALRKLECDFAQGYYFSESARARRRGAVALLGAQVVMRRASHPSPPSAPYNL